MIEPRLPPLYRYSRRRYLEELKRFGRVRFAHARTFRDSTLTRAQCDDEHHKIYNLDPSVPHAVDIWGRDEKIYHFENLPTLQMFHRIGDNEGRLIDYYLYCFTSKHDERFFSEFDADACLRISHPEEFFVRVIKACHARFPRCQFIGGKCKYYDPTQLPEPAKRSELAFMKSNSYSWQKEIRMFFYFKSEQEFEDYLTVDVGSIDDICEFV